MVASMNGWIEEPEQVFKWITNGKAVLTPKTKDLDNERNYRSITCLLTCYKIFTGMVGIYMKEHADRSDMWGRNQLGTCSGVLGTVDQLLIDRAIMDEVRGKKRNAAITFYDYQRAYDMVRHDWMERVYRWMGIPDEIV